MKQYDYLIVGAGLYGAVFAQEAKKAGKKCLVIDKRSHIAGNIYTEPVEGINVHRYGAHIFHTNNKAVWQYVNQFAEFNRYTNSPVANYHGEIYNLPFNMNNQFGYGIRVGNIGEYLAPDSDTCIFRSIQPFDIKKTPFCAHFTHTFIQNVLHISTDIIGCIFIHKACSAEHFQ